MRFDEAVRRLDPLPDVLPDAPEALIPVFRESGAPRPQPTWTASDASARPAAVLVLVFPDDDGEARLVLTERVDRGGHHSGEVSFPGGRAGAGRRRPRRHRAAGGRRGGRPRRRCGRCAGAGHAVDAVDPGQQLQRDPGGGGGRAAPSAGGRRPTEVAAILEVPLATFLPGGELLWVERQIREWDLRYAAYPVEGLAVWGMTARVLGGLGAWLAREEGP